MGPEALPCAGVVEEEKRIPRKLHGLDASREELPRVRRGVRSCVATPTLESAGGWRRSIPTGAEGA